jgi:hypothetical protein
MFDFKNFQSTMTRIILGGEIAKLHGMYQMFFLETFSVTLLFYPRGALE